jgi:hypothetical protein
VVGLSGPKREVVWSRYLDGTDFWMEGMFE